LIFSQVRRFQAKIFLSQLPDKQNISFRVSKFTYFY
jgi:hypothetical protein